VPTGFETNIVMRQVNFNKQSKPYSNCIENTYSESSFDSELYKQTVKVSKNYRQKYCLQLCSQRYLIINCGCYDANLPSLNYSVPCISLSNLTCGYFYYVQFHEEGYSAECFAECPVECQSISYGLTTSQLIYPSMSYSTLLSQYQSYLDIAYNGSIQREFKDYETIRKSSLAVNIYFEDIGYTIVNEYPAKTIEQFLADIGGLMGLCLGTSLLSFIELIEIGLEIFLLKVYSRNDRENENHHISEQQQPKFQISQIENKTKIIENENIESYLDNNLKSYLDYKSHVGAIF
jgi:hypothetical protein